MTADFDLIVIGSGPAGERGAVQGAELGKRVALIERAEQLGGACANTGTLPSKTLRETALFLSGLRQREIYGLEVRPVSGVSVREFMMHKEVVVDREHDRITANLASHAVTLIAGEAVFVGPDAIEVRRAGEVRRLTAERFLIATGSSPHRPGEVPFEDAFVDDSDEILNLDRMPQTMVVLGGGVIGCEYASVFAALGCRVTLIEGRERLLDFLDREVGDRLTAAFEKLGIDVVLGDKAVEMGRPPGKQRGIRCKLASGRIIETDRLLMAAGRSSNTAKLGLAAAGVDLGPRGRLLVDDHFRTSSPRIYGAGDVIGFPALASTSMDQGRVAVCHAFAVPTERHVASRFPYGLYTIPEVAMIGATEEELRERGVDYEVGRSSYADNARAQIINDKDGMMKLLFDRQTRLLLGVHVLGERSTEFIHIGQAVMDLGGTIDYFIGAVFNYPTLSEAYKSAAHDGLSRLAAGEKRP